MDKNQLRDIMLDQKEFFSKKNNLIERDLDLDSYLKTQQIVLISGIRRCGKSSLLYLIKERLNLKNEEFLYFNFDDERIFNFEPVDFNKLIEIHQEIYGLKDKSKLILFFDEIQNISFWEKFLNRMYEEKMKIFVTGSNANLLSSEIATSLTGRNIIIQLFPFSFKEFLRYYNFKYDLNVLSSNSKALLKNKFNEYFKFGGFPLVIKEKNLELIQSYYRDIIYRDIISRFNITQVNEIKNLSSYLLTNTSKLFSYSTLQRISKIKSLSTISKYLSYLEATYLFDFLLKYDLSFKKQLLNSKKVYVSDLAFHSEIGFKFSEDRGRLLENLVFIELKRRGKEIYYHRNRKECDFVIKEGLDIVEAIQVCRSLESGEWGLETRKREFDGLIDALKSYDLKEGLILTEDEEFEEVVFDKKSGKEFKIVVKPIWKWMLE